jgi:hypothetical protein
MLMHSAVTTSVVYQERKPQIQTMFLHAKLKQTETCTAYKSSQLFLDGSHVSLHINKACHIYVHNAQAVFLRMS